MFNTLKYYKLWMTVSGLILVFGVASLLTFGLNLGIDFTGGSLTEIKFQKAYDQNAISQILSEKGLEGFQLQTTENNGLLIKTKPLKKEELDAITDALKEKVGDHEVSRFESIGPVVGKELKQKAFYQLALVSLGILIYIGYAFRKIAKPVTPWKFGVAAVIARCVK